MTRLAADASSAAAARRFVARVLWERGFPADSIDDAVLLTSETVTEALVRAGTDIDLVVVADASMARIEVRDGGPAGPPADGATSANGSAGAETVPGPALRLLQALAEAWGIDSSGGGKCLWFEMRP